MRPPLLSPPTCDYKKKTLLRNRSSGADGEVRVEVIFDAIDRGSNRILQNFSPYLFKSNITSERHVFSIIMKEII